LPKIVILTFVLFIGGFSVLNIVWQAPTILTSERRVRERRPNFSFDSVTSGNFMAGFEAYAADRFPFRDGFRAVHAATVFGAFLQTDNDGIYFDSHGIGSFSAIDTDSVKLLADKINFVASELDSLNIFYAIIPDKSVYADRAMPGFDYALATYILPNVNYISLLDALSADSFYRTDLHWCQANITEVVNALAVAMDFEIYLEKFSQQLAGFFRGGYAGQFAIPVRIEPIYFMENPHIRAFYMNMATRELEEGPVYDLKLLHGIDPYDIFLRGAQPLIVLENENAATDRSLYIFRDSFASSLAPILAGAYSRVMLIDFRFIDLHVVQQLIDFTPGADALFLYSSGILNNADMLLIGGF